VNADRQWDDSGQPAVTVRQMVLLHDVEIEELKEWRSEMRGALALVKLTLGTSLVTGMLAILTLSGHLAGYAK